MTNEENIKLFKQLKDCVQGTREYDKLFTEIVTRNENFVWHIAKKYRSTHGYEFEDIFSIGKLGLIKAVQTFHVELGFQFATYAGNCISNQIKMYMRKQARRGGVILPFDEIVNIDTNGNQLTLKDILASDDDIEEHMLSNDEKTRQIQELERYIALLPSNQAEVLRLRYLSGDTKGSQYDISQKIGLSQTYISRLEKKAIKNLKILISKGTLKSTDILNKTNIEPKEIQKQALIEKIGGEPLLLQSQLRNFISVKLTKEQARVLQTLYLSSEEITLKTAAENLNKKVKSFAAVEVRGVKNLQKVISEELGKELSTKDIRMVLKYREENEE